LSQADVQVPPFEARVPSAPRLTHAATFKHIEFDDPAVDARDDEILGQAEEDLSSPRTETLRSSIDDAREQSPLQDSATGLLPLLDRLEETTPFPSLADEAAGGPEPVAIVQITREESGAASLSTETPAVVAIDRERFLRRAWRRVVQFVKGLGA
jgi:hypothetical protein